MSNFDQTVREMAQLTVLTNRISETQARNMGLFPKIFFEGLKEIKIDYDLERKQAEKENEYDTSNSRVDYYLKIPKKKMVLNTSIEKRYAALEKAIRDLFWGDVKVSISINNKLEFRSADVVSNETKT